MGSVWGQLGGPCVQAFSGGAAGWHVSPPRPTGAGPARPAEFDYPDGGHGPVPPSVSPLREAGARLREWRPGAPTSAPRPARGGRLVPPPSPGCHGRRFRRLGAVCGEGPTAAVDAWCDASQPPPVDRLACVSLSPPASAGCDRDTLAGAGVCRRRLGHLVAFLSAQELCTESKHRIVVPRQDRCSL